jgi:hypothetical protein
VPGEDGGGAVAIRFHSLTTGRRGEVETARILSIGVLGNHGHMSERATGRSSEELRDEVARAIEHSRWLAGKVAEVEERVAAVEDQLAETNDQLTAQRGDPKYRERADEARAMAKLAREMAEREREVVDKGD